MCRGGKHTFSHTHTRGGNPGKRDKAYRVGFGARKHTYRCANVDFDGLIIGNITSEAAYSGLAYYMPIIAYPTYFFKPN